MGSLILVRHCSAAWSEDQAERPLSDDGHDQARRLGAWLHGRWLIDAIIASPYRRTKETIQPFADRSGLPIQLDDRLRERDAPFLADAAAHIAATEACFADHSLRQDGAETGFEAQHRGWQAIETAMRMYRLPVLVSHGQLISFTLARIDGTSGAGRWREMTTPDVFLLERTDDGGIRIERVWPDLAR